MYQVDGTMITEPEHREVDTYGLATEQLVSFLKECSATADRDIRSITAADFVSIVRESIWAFAIPDERGSDSPSDSLFDAIAHTGRTPMKFLKQKDNWNALSNLLFIRYFAPFVFDEQQGLPLLNCLTRCEICRRDECNLYSLAVTCATKTNRVMGKVLQWAKTIDK